MATKITKEEELALFKEVVEDLPIDLDVLIKFFKIQKNKDGSPKRVNGKPKIDGKQLALKLKETDAYSPTLLAWIEAQNNFTDSIKYLMEKEIITSGGVIRDLSQHIPRVRDLEKLIVEHNNGSQEQEQAFVNRTNYSIPRDNNDYRQISSQSGMPRNINGYQEPVSQSSPNYAQPVIKNETAVKENQDSSVELNSPTVTPIEEKSTDVTTHQQEIEVTKPAVSNVIEKSVETKVEPLSTVNENKMTSSSELAPEKGSANEPEKINEIKKEVVSKPDEKVNEIKEEVVSKPNEKVVVSEEEKKNWARW